MSESYTKLMASIVHSTVWSESLPTKVVWITMLALSDRQGYVGASVPGLAKTAGVTIDECEEALRRLHAPDPHSRTKEHEGRRVATTERGWFILNYQAHRDRMDAETVRETKRLWWQRHRGKETRPLDQKLDRTRSTRRDSTQAAPAPAPDNSKKEKESSRPKGNYKPGPHIKAWAERKGFGPTFDLHLEHFNDYIAQPKNARRYVNLDAAFRSCLRADWGGIREQLERKQRKASSQGQQPAVENPPCGNCRKPITGSWTDSEKGKVCNDCWNGYMNGAWPQ